MKTHLSEGPKVWYAHVGTVVHAFLGERLEHFFSTRVALVGDHDEPPGNPGGRLEHMWLAKGVHDILRDAFS